MVQVQSNSIMWWHLKGSLDDLFSVSQGGKVIAGKLGTEPPGKGRGQLRGS